MVVTSALARAVGPCVNGRVSELVRGPVFVAVVSTVADTLAERLAGAAEGAPGRRSGRGRRGAGRARQAAGSVYKLGLRSPDWLKIYAVRTTVAAVGGVVPGPGVLVEALVVGSQAQTRAAPRRAVLEIVEHPRAGRVSCRQVDG
jgi:hypothetical protein